MAGRMTIFVFLSLVFAGILKPASAGNCPSSESFVGEKSFSTVYQWMEKGEMEVSTTMYVQPRDDFKGLSVEVMQMHNHSRYEYAAWFPKDHCFPRLLTWTEMYVEVKAIESLYESFKYDLRFQLKIGNCTKICRRTPQYVFINRLIIVAHGSSEWSSIQPSSTCPIVRMFKKPHITEMSNCIEPPTPALTGPSFTPLEVAGIVAMVVVVVAVVSVVVVKLSFKLRTSSSEPSYVMPLPARPTYCPAVSRVPSAPLNDAQWSSQLPHYAPPKFMFCQPPAERHCENIATDDSGYLQMKGQTVEEADPKNLSDFHLYETLEPSSPL